MSCLAVRDVLDAKAGLQLLVFGTIGGVVATIVGALTLTFNQPSGLDLVLSVTAGILAYVGGWCWKRLSAWAKERRLLVHCFLVWLEGEGGGQEAKGSDFELAVVSTGPH